jgi:prophage tail gpP-like protein
MYGYAKKLVFKKGMTLLDICREVAAPYGITCYSSNGSGGVVTQTAVGDAFGRVEQDATQPDGEFLQDLAKQKGFLITSLPDGNLLLCRANTEDKPACSSFKVLPTTVRRFIFYGSKRYSNGRVTEESEFQDVCHAHRSTYSSSWLCV